MFGNDLNVELFYLSKAVWFWCQCAAEHMIVKRAAAFVRRRAITESLRSVDFPDVQTY